MQYTSLGGTGLRVSVAGLGTGGFSRMGLKSGRTEEESARLILEAVELGVNFIDTAPPYGTEGVVGKALKSIPRQSVVVATKSTVHRNDEWWTPERVVQSLDNSLRAMGTDYVDVFNLHAVEPQMYDYALDTLAPALVKEKEKGKLRHIGLTENPIVDFANEMLGRALRDPVLGSVHGGLPPDAPGRPQQRVSGDAPKAHRHADHVRGAQHVRRSAAGGA